MTKIGFKHLYFWRDRPVILLVPMVSQVIYTKTLCVVHFKYVVHCVPIIPQQNFFLKD